MANVERCDPAVYRQQWEYYYSVYILVDRFETSLYLMGFVLMIYTGKYLVFVYVRPCTKYPTHGIKACVAKQGDTSSSEVINFEIAHAKSYGVRNSIYCEIVWKFALKRFVRNAEKEFYVERNLNFIVSIKDNFENI
ncbi:hypothetical protein BpHYR1_017145 [Brachionus plicatilis]|uniref:Uncharacterized protein n=1 Tax=Brachionus plicatilis TaxID=10195 RepID=A0A3M7QKW2_BRAPC|nr:hypothetical protein BpHYR1_017145 [Brachionus plicatilis]